jgi:hypothetical protein
LKACFAAIDPTLPRFAAASRPPAPRSRQRPTARRSCTAGQRSRQGSVAPVCSHGI